ncbi:helix-turn-helix transcriptional regulator [Kineosporia sp. J2-2]|uniref:Helix-turn-helix transcriptional regulator n=1 Tax=Kineosporia corallincola TaxID=2835133 RepID=A0ABS5TDH3_9ACTN|nr:AraC family transcriptional regulator [Kineosporia corallincola]MBT0769130.1 helix-turn-helix transcriptional regulator [Kineosporia corallincola]
MGVHPMSGTGQVTRVDRCVPRHHPARSRGVIVATADAASRGDTPAGGAPENDAAANSAAVRSTPAGDVPVSGPRLSAAVRPGIVRPALVRQAGATPARGARVPVLRSAGNTAALARSLGLNLPRAGAHPVSCDEFGYGPGRPEGLLVLRYRSSGPLEFAESRQAFLHQFYLAPAGVLSVRQGDCALTVAAGEVFWVRRGVAHEVTARAGQPVYRVCLADEPERLRGLRAGAATIDPGAAELVRVLGAAGFPVPRVARARARVLAGLGAGTRRMGGNQVNGAGYAMRVAQALTRDPGDPTGLEEWARRLHVSVKTLQRDFVKEFGISYTQWRTRLRLLASRVLLETTPVTEVARRVGYASTSAFIVAFTREFGITPGRQRAS